VGGSGSTALDSKMKILNTKLDLSSTNFKLWSQIKQNSLMIMIFKVHNFSSEQSLQLLAPGTKKLVMSLCPITEVQSNGHQRYQKHDLKLTVLCRMNKKAITSSFRHSI
jgi:hypothetical protein